MLCSCTGDERQYRSKTSGGKIIPSSEISTSPTNEPGGLLPRVIGSANVAAANAETANLKTATNNYYLQKGFYPDSSFDLTSLLNGTPKATYYFDRSIGLVNRVDSIDDGWINMVFSLSNQKWLKGTADDDHLNDQDIP
jgi:hypothetical protein